MSTENPQQPNSSEAPTSEEKETIPDESLVELTQQPRVDSAQPNIEFANPSILILRQTPSEISGSKVKRLREIIREQGFNLEKPI